MAKRLREETVSSEVDEGPSVDSQCKSRSQSTDSSVHTPKYASLEDSTETTAMRCLLPPHRPLNFSTYAEYESHYEKAHTNRCTECKKNFPTSHFLNLHIAENHDPIVATKRDAGEKTFACFVEGCEKVCRDWKKRRSHLVDKHLYPKNYDFLVVDHGIDGRRSMLRPGVDAQGHRKSSRERGRRASSISEGTQATEATSGGDEQQRETSSSDQPKAEGAATSNDVKDAKARVNEIDDLTSSMSSLKMVPRSITFGKRKGRSGFARD